MNAQVPIAAAAEADLVLADRAGLPPPLLLPGENGADYADLAAKIRRAAPPRDFIEELLTRDAVDLTWDIIRLRRLKAGALRAAAGAGVKDVMLTLKAGGPLAATKFARRWRSGDPAAREELLSALAQAGLTMDDVIAQGLANALDTVERLDRMLASAEARRVNAWREIDRHRDTLGAAVRKAVEEVEDAVFRDLETGDEGRGPQP